MGCLGFAKLNKKSNVGVDNVSINCKFVKSTHLIFDVACTCLKLIILWLIFCIDFLIFLFQIFLSYILIVGKGGGLIYFRGELNTNIWNYEFWLKNNKLPPPPPLRIKFKSKKIPSLTQHFFTKMHFPCIFVCCRSGNWCVLSAQNLCNEISSKSRLTILRKLDIFSFRINVPSPPAPGIVLWHSFTARNR